MWAQALEGKESQLLQRSVSSGRASLTQAGALVVDTTPNTGRSTEERYVLRDESNEKLVAWGKSNQPLNRELADPLFNKVIQRLIGSDCYQVQAYVAHVPLTVYTTSPWHALFARTMFRKIPLSDGGPERTLRIYHDPYGKVSDYGVSLPHEKIIVLDTREMRILIIGTAYAGEIKKSAFSMANFLLPDLNHFPMHAAANCRPDGTESCVLFGLSGTGKTSLSADPARALIGDDEIVWSPTGLSNLEGGCYAKLINLDPEKEPLIYKAVLRPGAILENVVVRSDGNPDFSDQSKTENTRGSYPIEFLENIYPQDREAEEPRSVVFLTADAFGALPAVAKLDLEQARYHFLSGYTAKLAGTEIGVTEPQATFSACFGAPFMPRPSSVYADLLVERLRKSGASVWILNTGWTGGAYGKGKRFPFAVSRALLRAIQNGQLEREPMREHPIFGFQVPLQCAGVDPSYLSIPEGPHVEELARKFAANFKKFGMRAGGGPRLSREAS